MLLQYLYSHYALPYVMIGVVITLLIDLTIAYTKSSERLTFVEIMYSIIAWPLMLYVFIRGFFNQD